MKKKKTKKSRPPISDRQKELIADLRNGNSIWINLYGYRWLIEPLSSKEGSGGRMLAYIPHRSRCIIGIVTGIEKNGYMLGYLPEQDWIPLHSKRLILLGDVIESHKIEAKT